MTRSLLRDVRLFREDAFINGEWRTSVDTFVVQNPSTGSTLAQVIDADAEMAREAIEAAAQAFKTWKTTLAKERARILQAWHQLVLASAEDLALLMTLEQGKPICEARGEIAYGAAFLEWFAEESKRIYGDTIPSSASDRRIVVLKEPVGVVGAITPWNFPVAMITRKAGAALAAGCTMVLKPAEDTPLCALALAELAQRAGVPAGVFNVVPTSQPESVGQELCSHPQVRKLTFTGSTQVGQTLLAQCASTVKKVSMELGGNAPFIVFEDADLDQAVEGAIASKYRNAGQTCICANRILVHASVYSQFVAKLTEKVQQLVVGDGQDKDVSIGPLINTAAIDRVKALVDEAVSLGAQRTFGGGVSARGPLFYEPCVLTQVTPEMRIFSEEIFGPVAAITAFESEEEAIQLANDTPFGLAAYFYSRDIGRAWRVMEGLEYGMVAVNEGQLSTEVAPFGGVKQSGIGREGSKYGIEDYVEVKYGLFGGL